jgi:multidrug efflux pump subunit AcrB
MEEGWDRKLAAKKATGEVAMPVIAATLTTLAAFAPLLFWPGMTGEFMGYLPTTLIVTLSSSLFVALVIVPSLCGDFMRLEHTPRKGMTPAARGTVMAVGLLALLVVLRVNPLTAGLLVFTAAVVWALFHFVLRRFTRFFQARLVPSMLSGYERQLRWALEHRGAILGAAVLSFVVTVALFGRFNHGIEFFPEDIPPRQIFVDIETPVGTRADATNELVERLEAQLGAVPGRSDWKSRVAAAGSGGGNAISSAMGQGGPSGPDRGRISLSIVDFQDQEFDVFETLAWMQENIGTEIAGAEVTVERLQEGVSGGPAVNVEIVGEDPAILKQLSDRVILTLENHPVFTRMVGLESDLDAARPELSVAVDRERAALYDLSTLDVGQAVRGAIQGVEAAKYRTGNDEFDIVVRLAPEYRRELDQLAGLTVVAEGGRQIPLSSVASWSVGEGYATIQRKDQTRMATVSADAAAGVNSNALLAETRAALADFEATIPPGYTVQYTGQQEDQAEAQEFLTTAFLIALFLIGFILVSQFNSVIKPVIILTSVLMSTVGVLLGLLVFAMPFGIIMTGVGIISLAGIVVNNAIVLIDYIDILRERDGMNRREALVQGGRTRFRPVVLTAATTALGLVPLAIGLNFDFFGLYSSLSPELYWGGDQAAWWGPMAVAVIAGIIFATFLTLVLVPVLYSLVDDVSGFFRRHYTHRGDVSGPVGDGDDPPRESLEVEVPPRVLPTREREPAAVLRGRVRSLGGPELQPE